jgi:hypothetical protein
MALFLGDGPAGVMVVVVVEPAGSMLDFEYSTKQPYKPPEQLLTNDGDGISSFMVYHYDYYCGDEASLSRLWHHNMSIIVARWHRTYNAFWTAMIFTRSPKRRIEVL